MITNITLTTKERYLLEDQKSHEEICIQKYTNYANLASDSHLKEIFQNHAQIEREHLYTIDQLLNGQVPSMNSGQGNQNQPQKTQQTPEQQKPKKPEQNTFSHTNNTGTFRASDKELCTDMLMTEKYVSNSYNIAIFEFKDTEVRDVLNHIQKEEQKHGEAIFKYMESVGMYNTQ